MVDFLLLGVLEWRPGAAAVDLGAPKQRAVLAVLLSHAGRPVPLSTLIDCLWDDWPPAEARNVVYAHIARIRRLLTRAGPGCPVQLHRRAGGYVLDVDPERVDVHRFRRLVGQARAAADDEERARLLRSALELWRGPAMADLPGAWAGRMRDLWTQRHLDALVAWAEAELRLGNPAVPVNPLVEALADNPLAEGVAGVLMRALSASGRSAAALACYSRVRQRVADTLGVEPSPELQRIQQQILGDEPPPAARPARPVPAQLPRDVPAFIGRAAELAGLGRAGAGGRGMCVLSGGPGVGKTALAVHWAHRAGASFPDGQLYVALHGYAPGGPALSPAEALDGFLRALGVDQLPTEVAEKAALYRSRLAGRRILVVLDDARDAEQVRPLLPGAAGCMAVVTSRDQLSGLVAGEGAQWVRVGLPSDAEARRILAGRLPERPVAEPQAVADLLCRCGRLPLALAIVAARAATRPDLPLASLLEREPGGAELDLFAGPDAATDLRAVFAGSYRALGAAAARVFRQLGRHPGTDFTVPAAARLAAVPVARARAAVGELCQAQLVTEEAPGRFRLHPLVHGYARELAGPTGAAGTTAHRLSRPEGPTGMTPCRTVPAAG